MTVIITTIKALAAPEVSIKNTVIISARCSSGESSFFFLNKAIYYTALHIYSTVLNIKSAKLFPMEQNEN